MNPNDPHDAPDAVLLDPTDPHTDDEAIVATVRRGPFRVRGLEAVLFDAYDFRDFIHENPNRQAPFFGCLYRDDDDARAGRIGFR